MMRILGISLTVAAVGALLWVAVGAFISPGGAIDDGAPKFVSASAGAGWSQPPVAVTQDAGPAAEDKDTRVGVQVWTVTAAGTAMAAGLILFLLRIIMGWVKPPPSQEQAHH